MKSGPCADAVIFWSLVPDVHSALGSLFWRIFLAFWVAMATITVAIVYVSFTAADRASDAMRVGLQPLVDEAEAILRSDGTDGLRAWLDEPRPGPRLLVFDERGTELLGRPVDRRTKRRLEFESRRRRGAIVLTGMQGERYRALPAPPALRLGPLRFDSPRPLIVTTALVISALVCLLLSRYIVGPIRRIDTAARALGGGDLRARAHLHSGGNELISLGREFDAMAERVETLLMSQRELLRNVSHELRSPLARLRLALELARTEETRTEAALARIERETVTLDRLIGEVLALARVTDPGASIAVETVELGSLVTGVVTDARFEGESRAIRIQFDDSAAPVEVRGPAALLTSAIENVIRNAVRYSDDGGTVDVELRRNGEWAEVRVLDRGPGVAAEKLSLIFEPFYRTDAGRERSSGGEGIGLAISKAVVDRIGGSVQATNRDGGGLEVTLRLPLDMTADRKAD